MENSDFGRIAGALVAPNKTFASIAQRPSWLVAFFFLILTSLAAAVVITPKVDMEQVVRDSLEQQGRSVSADELETAVEMGEKFRWVGAVMQLVFAPIVYLLCAAILMVCFKLMGGEIDFRTSWAASLHGWMPMAVLAVLMIPVVMGQSEVSAEAVNSGKFLSSHLGVFAPEGASKALKTLLSSLDFFSFWTIATMSIAYKHAARVSIGTSASIVTGLWVLWIAGKIGLGMIF